MHSHKYFSTIGKNGEEPCLFELNNDDSSSEEGVKERDCINNDSVIIDIDDNTMDSQNLIQTQNNENVSEIKTHENINYEVGQEFKFFRIDKGYIPQHSYDLMQKNKIDLSDIDLSHPIKDKDGKDTGFYECINQNSDKMHNNNVIWQKSHCDPNAIPMDENYEEQGKTCSLF